MQVAKFYLYLDPWRLAPGCFTDIADFPYKFFLHLIIYFHTLLFLTCLNLNGNVIWTVNISENQKSVQLYFAFALCVWNIIILSFFNNTNKPQPQKQQTSPKHKQLNIEQSHSPWSIWETSKMHYIVQKHSYSTS